MGDLWNQFKLRLHLIFCDRNICVLFGISVIISVFLAGILTEAAKTRSNIPIGVVDLDQTEMSAQLSEKVSLNPSLYVCRGSFESLRKKMDQQEIELIFVIEEGFEKRVMQLDTKELISVYCLEGDKVHTILSDIFAGEMIYDICRYKSYQTYQAMGEDYALRSKEDFFAYTDALHESADYDFSFDMEVIEPKYGRTLTDSMDNSVLYKQIVISVLAMLISFVMLFGAGSLVMEKESEVSKRIRISLIGRTARGAGNYLAVFTAGAMMSVICWGMLCWKTGIFGGMAGWRLLLLFLIYGFVMGVLFYCISLFIKSVIHFQLAGSVLILLLGVVGFLVQILNKFQGQFLNFLKLLPNCWFIRAFTDIIVNIID